MRHRLRVARVEAGSYSPVLIDGQPVGSWHPRLDAVIRRYQPPIVASLLTAPVVAADGAVEFYSDLEGQPIPLTQVSGPARTQAETLLAERLSALRVLAERLAADPAQVGLAQALRAAAVLPPPENVYLIGGQPVIIRWGGGGRAVPAVAVAPVAAGAAGGAVVGGAAAGAAIAARRGWWRWLLLALLLLLLLAALLFGLKGCGTGLSVPETDRSVSDPALKSLQDDEARLRQQADELKAQLRQRLESCPVPEKPAEPASPQSLPKTELTKPDLPVTPVPPAPEEKPKAEKADPKPVDKPPQPQPPADKPQADKPQTDKPPAAKPPAAPQKQANACPPPRQKWEAPEVVLLLDASGSMAISAGVSQQEIESLYRRAMMGDAAALQRLKGMINQPGKSRLDMAKSSVLSTLPHLPSDVDVGLIVIGECKGADNYKFFGSGERGKLGELLSGITPRQGTPLARGIERAGNMMDGTTVPGVLIVLSDGDDSCGGDPCAAARALAQRKPKLKINFIDVNGDGSGSCVVEPSGGKVYSPKQVTDLPELIQKASEQPVVGSNCP